MKLKIPQIKLHFLASYLSLPLYQQPRDQSLLELLFIVVMVGHKADDKYTVKVRPIHTIDVMAV